ncbi:MAG: efflux RND transporter periplasmic adaptor subunit, partial [Deltaproteobacteria bacterium]|nr:efflux RND transporter periplasmic adaptor subunit [Deltaproteobacteria bacterium]
SRDGGSPAEVRLAVGAKTHTWPGRVVRSLGEVDPRGRMAQLVVRVTDPYSLMGRKDRPGLDLAPGLFVAVWLLGKSVEDVFAIPANALRTDSTVWVIDTESLLEIRPVRVLHREMEDILIESGLSAGDRIVLTRLSGAVPGMKLREADREVLP